MMELKTLKDIDLVCDNCARWDIDTSGLKREAIKWIKLMKSNDFYEHPDINNWLFSDPTDIHAFLTYFFNITEEDLK